MKLPRDVGGHELAHLLARVGYRVVRQTGIHIRLAVLADGEEHHVTVPAHKPLRVGTLAGILADVGGHLHVEREELLKTLFG